MIGLPAQHSCKICIIGLGYVGLPLAVKLANTSTCEKTGLSLRRKIIGFDLNEVRLKELKDGFDRTNQISIEDLNKSSNIKFTSKYLDISQADIFIVTVPTPIDKQKRPDLSFLKNACTLIGKSLRIADSQKDINNLNPVIIFESTVFPGATEEVCVPILEKESLRKYNLVIPGKGFYCGYSPERINPGDNKHTLSSITKVTSGSNEEVLEWVDNFYGSIIKSGTYKASSIKVAEAAKVIENTQRDLNIALINEFAIIFKHLGLDTRDVLAAAETKWNFLPFYPGLVGGHCIGVDPYYLTSKSEEMGYQPQLLLAGRRINDGMGEWVGEQLILEMAKKNLIFKGSKVLILGFTFKENCPDMRNTKVIDTVISINKFNIKSTIVDPWVNKEEVKEKYHLDVLNEIPLGIKYNAILLAVAHDDFRELDNNSWGALLEEGGILFDLKGIIPRNLNPKRL